jgi:hypothetical protein
MKDIPHPVPTNQLSSYIEKLEFWEIEYIKGGVVGDKTIIYFADISQVKKFKEAMAFEYRARKKVRLAVLMDLLPPDPNTDQDQSPKPEK